MTFPSGNLVGMIAGEGELPLEAARSMEMSGQILFVIAFEGITSKKIEIPGREVIWKPFGQLQPLLDSLKEGGVQDLILSGRIGITSIYDPSRFDEPLLKLLASLKDHRGNTILAGIAQEFTREGFRVLSNLDAASNLITPAGIIAGREPGPEQWADILFGWGIVRELARLDVGQTVVVKGRSVVAVEAMEGTDQTILRAGQITAGNLVVVKVSSPDHDFRFDVPTVGSETVRSLSRSGGGVLAVEAGRSFLLDGDELSRIAEEEGICVVGVDGGSLGLEP
jgi:DUF1009 family protein